MDTCKNCLEDIESDGHGELIHSETFKYGCVWPTKAKAYPVAS